MGKSRFLEVPSFWPVPDGKGHWVARDRIVFYSDRYDCTIYIEAGSLNNLASIPWIFRRMFAVNGPHRIAAALHDPLYELKGVTVNRTFSKKECDLLFYDAMLASKRSVFEAYSGIGKLYVGNANLKSPLMDDSPTVNPMIAKLMHAGLRVAFWREWV